MEYKRKPSGYVFRSTPCGAVKGIRKDGYLLFKGIRFATAERFEAPVLVDKWEGTYDATKYGPACIQHFTYHDCHNAYSDFYYDQSTDKNVYQYSEDCLNLNIWTPEDAENAPVAVFVHGGSFTGGSNTNVNIANGVDYCKRGIILVTVNYRLNAFGSAIDESHKGNQMLKDLVAAMKWIKANIAAFGGDPQKITGIGESAGALALQDLLYCEEMKGVLAGSVMMSGGGNLDTMNVPSGPEFATTCWKMVMEKYGVTSLAGLKHLSSQELYEAWYAAASSDVNIFNNCAKPVIDGEMIPTMPSILMDQGRVIDIPCIFGMSSQDMWPYTLYNKIVEWGAYTSNNGRAPMYAYYLDRQIPGGDNVGAYHGVDLWYAFGTLDYNWRPFEEIDYRISENMIDYFASFIKTGNPNDGKLPEWKPNTAQCPEFIRLGDELPAMYRPPVDQLATAIQNLKPFPGM